VAAAYSFGRTQEVVRDGGQLRAPIPTENVNATGADTQMGRHGQARSLSQATYLYPCLPVACLTKAKREAEPATMAAPRRGKNTITRTACLALSLLLLLLVLLVTPAHSRPQGLTPTISGQKGSTPPSFSY
jgi:hypothetical protein